MKKRCFIFFFFAIFIFCCPGFSSEYQKKENTSGRVITLGEARKLAVKNNPSIKNLDETIFQANASINSAWSMLLPHISAEGSITLNQHEIIMGFPDFTAPPEPDGTQPITSLVIQEKWMKSFSISANMALFNPRSIPLISVAYDNSHRQRLMAYEKKNDLLFAVTSAYYQANSQKELIKISEENLKMAHEFLRKSEARVQVGQVTKIDSQRAKLAVLDAQKTLADAHGAYRLTLTGLSNLIGATEIFLVTGPSSLNKIEETDIGALKKQALKDRAEIQNAELSKAIADKLKNENLMRWLPKFDVTYVWSWSSATGFSGENNQWMLIFGAKWNLFDGGDRLARRKIANSEARMAANNMDALVLSIKAEVEKAYENYLTQKRTLEITLKQVNLAQDTHEMVKSQYDAGLVSSLEVTISHTSLASRKLLNIIEKLKYDLAILTLQKAIGEYDSLLGKKP